MNVAASIARRGIEAYSAEAGDGTKHRDAFSALFLIAVAVVGCLYIATMFTIEYTCGQIIPTLIMIESPQDSRDAISFKPLPTEDHDSKVNDPEPSAESQQFITSSFRRTLRHLGGFQARFRGLCLFIFTNILTAGICSLLASLPLLHYLPRGLTSTAAAVLCAQLRLTWTHIVISQPKAKSWFRRMPPMKMWKQVALPTAVCSLAEQFAVYIPAYIALFAGLWDHNRDDLAKLTPNQKAAMGLTGAGLTLFAIILSFVIVLPANVILTRVQASLLDDTEETIVPFDRTFGGKVVPELVGGSGAIGMLDAWKTFDRASRIRLVKAFFKVVGMQIGVTFFFSLCVAAMFLIVTVMA